MLKKKQEPSWLWGGSSEDHGSVLGQELLAQRQAMSQLYFHRASAQKDNMER